MAHEPTDKNNPFADGKIFRCNRCKERTDTLIGGEYGVRYPGGVCLACRDAMDEEKIT